MKYEITKNILRAALVLTLFAIGFQTANAQEKRLAQSPKEFQVFFAKFKTAVEKKNKTSVASMTVFPFRYGFDAGDEGAMTRAQFIKRFAEIFGAEPKRFVDEPNPLYSKNAAGEYALSYEDATYLVFIKSGKSFKFKTYIVEP